MRTPRTCTLALVVVALSLAATPSPARAPSELSLRGGGQIMLDPGAHAFGPKAELSQVELAYARSLVALWRGALWVEGSLALSHQAGRAFQRFDIAAWPEFDG